MKALVLDQPRSARVTDIAEPAQAAGSVLLKVRLVGLCGSDLNSFRGKNPLVSFPRILGHEVAATVISSSQSNSTLKSGTNVAVLPYTSCGRCSSCRRNRPNACQFNQTMGVRRDGALAELISVPAEKLYPAELPLSDLCLVEPLTIGFHAVTRGRVTSKDTVAILGCGGVGLGAIAASHQAGARTVAVDLDDSKLDLARNAGAAHTINADRQNVHDALNHLTDGFGPDVVIEAIGRPETFRMAIEEVAFTGRVVYIGYAKELVSYETRLFVQKELDILGSRNATPEDFRAVIQMLRRGEFPVKDAITSVVDLFHAPHALKFWDENPAKVQKIIVSLD